LKKKFGHKSRLGRRLPSELIFRGFFSRRRYGMCNMFLVALGAMRRRDEAC
jgi:hypothetical protein